MNKKFIKVLLGTLVVGTMLGGITVEANAINLQPHVRLDTVLSDSQVQHKNKETFKKDDLHNTTDQRKQVVQNKIENSKTTTENEKEHCSTQSKQRKNTSSDNSKEVYEQYNYENFHISFYTSLSNENTNSGTGTDDRGKPLVYGDVADNFLPYGTKIYLKGLGTFTVRDVGSPVYFTNEYTLDVFIPREAGETNQEYYNRVNNMGRQIVKGYIIKQ